MGFGVFKSPQENFENYKNKYAKQNQLISRGDLNGINQILNGDWAKQQPWYEAYQMARVQDFSKFEQIDPLVRSFLATVFMNRLMLVEASSKRIPETDPNAKNQPLPDFSVPPLGLHLSANANEISDELKTFMRENKHNPLFRLGCSMLSRPNETAVRTKAQIQADKRKADRFREIDDQMTEMIMEDTLRPMSEMQIRNARMMAGSQEAADELIQTNIEKQVTVAKTLFLTHIGKTFITTSTLNEKGKIVSTKQENLQRSVASMVSHCSRTGFVLPPGQTADVNEMMESILGSNTGKSSGIYGRFAATHSTENGRSVKEYKEAKGICLRKQYGYYLQLCLEGSWNLHDRKNID